MAKPKDTQPDTRTQKQKFIDKARELETDDRPEVFDRVLSAIAKAPPPAAKTAAKKRKR
ncbi:DNA-binding protein [Hyphomicrobium sp.]|uniref:DNA-binding protein n=1 Tax=Hyphomicrobium sp. TaxID=82 RepID=UPI000FB36976|nr:DNA-binding protein [Hyphomicrobium sp.]RUO98026.1 MAG: DNA-binding protein [Hyphomicrobium sp.]